MTKIRIVIDDARGKAGPILNMRCSVNALEAKVMDGDDCLCVTDFRIRKQGLLINRNKTRLPVVAVDDIRIPVQIVEYGKRCL